VKELVGDSQVAQGRSEGKLEQAQNKLKRNAV